MKNRHEPPDCALIRPEVAFRRIMMAVNPDYFSWETAEQERFRLGLSDEECFRIERDALKILFDIRVDTKEKMDAVCKTFKDEHYLLFNETMLFFQGIGDDLFYLNEYLDNNRTLLDFETLYDYDYDDHCFQEKSWKEEVPDYIAKPYRRVLYYQWARLHIDGTFFYADLSMMANYLYGVIEEIGFDKIQELIPYEYVDGKNHGKREGKGTLFDWKLMANGKEAQLEELQRRYRVYTGERQKVALDDFDAGAQKRVYLVDKSEKVDPHMRFIFTDQSALQGVRFRHFMADCRSMLGDNQELDAFIEQERLAAAEFLEQNHRDIMENFDPKITRLRKKRKIIIADGALNDLF